MLALILSIGTLPLLSGCSGGGGSSPAASISGIISGTAVKGPVGGGTVTAYAVSNGVMGSQLASATTDSQGNFQISIGAYSGPVMLQLSGGTYVDEASGATMSMSSGDVMTAVIPTVTSGGTVSNIQVTPLTAMAQAMANNMTGGMSDTNIAAASTSVGNFFMVNDILHTSPMNPLMSDSGATASQDMKNYGMVIAAMSQSAKDMGMTSSSSMVTAMMKDASDGVMNGMMGGTSIPLGGMGSGMMGSAMMQSSAGTSGLATAMTQFMTSTMNKSGLTATDMLLLMNRLNSSTGTF
jgi:hypothetical protein